MILRWFEPLRAWRVLKKSHWFNIAGSRLRHRDISRPRRLSRQDENAMSQMRNGFDGQRRVPCLRWQFDYDLSTCGMMPALIY